MQDEVIKTDKSSFERVVEFIYLGTTLTNQNCIQEEIKSRLKSGNACYHSVQNLLVGLDGLKLNGTHQLLAYADDVNILGGTIHTLKENAEALVAATREIELEVGADKTKYMVMIRDQNAGRIHSVRTDNSIFERVE